MREVSDTRKRVLNSPPQIPGVRLVINPRGATVVMMEFFHRVPIEMRRKGRVGNKLKDPFPWITILKLELKLPTFELGTDFGGLKLEGISQIKSCKRMHKPERHIPEQQPEIAPFQPNFG
jgi:hypothetical protein